MIGHIGVNVLWCIQCVFDNNYSKRTSVFFQHRERKNVLGSFPHSLSLRLYAPTNYGYHGVRKATLSQVSLGLRVLSLPALVCVTVSVCVSVCQPRGCPHENPIPVQASQIQTKDANSLVRDSSYLVCWLTLTHKVTLNYRIIPGMLTTVNTKPLERM